jgi:light-regulated signal transduction histidine kinase (bacteriophytochrome)
MECLDCLGCLDEDYRQFAIETCARAVRLYANGRFQQIKDIHPLLDVDALMQWLGRIPSSHIASMMKDPQLLRSTVAYEDFACKIISVEMYEELIGV